MKFDDLRVKKSREGELGIVFGEKRISCYRCGDQYLVSELATIPPNAEVGRPRVYICKNCL